MIADQVELDVTVQKYTEVVKWCNTYIGNQAIYMKHIVAHPWNKLPEHKGSIREIIGYGCNMPEFDSTVFFETEHSLCEMHDWQKKINDK